MNNENKLTRFLDRINTPLVQKIGNKLIEKKYLYPSFLLPVGIMLIVFACLSIFPFGNRAVLILDMSGQYVYFFEQLRDVLLGNGSLIYSFERALGGEFFGTYTYYLASPLSSLITLFPKSMITEGIMTIMLLKCGFAGLSFSYYLDKTRKKNVFGFTMFSTMYALCAYATTYQSNTMWIDALIWLPLITLGIERIVKHGHFKLFVISLALTIWSNYYIGYMCCIFVALYFACYLFAHSNEEINGLNEKLHRLKSLGRIALYSLVAILMAGVIICVAYYSLSFGKSEFQQNDFSPSLRFDISTLAIKLFPGSYDTVRDEGLPNIYCGLLMLIMLPVYYFSNKISAREKIFYSALCAIFLISFSINTVDLVWHGFQAPIWLNYRYSFMFSFVALIMAYRGFEHVKDMNGRFFFKVSLVLIATVIVLQKIVLIPRYVDGSLTEVMPDYEIIWLSIGFIVAYMLIFYFFKHPFKNKQLMSIILIACVGFEALAATLLNWGDQISDVGWASRTKYTSFVSRLTVAMDQIEKSDDSFFRTEKTVFRKPNDAFAINMRGVSEFNSTFNQGVISFLHKAGFLSRSQASKYFSGNEVIDSILGIKYVIGEGPNKEGIVTDSVSGLYSPSKVEGENLIIYENPYVLPIAYGVNNGLKNYVFDEDIHSPFNYTETLLSQMLGVENANVFTSCKYKASALDNCVENLSKTSTQYRRKSSDKSCAITFTVTAVRDGSIYMYFPSPYSTKASTYVNGKHLADLFQGDAKRMFNIGNFKKGDTVDVRLEFNHSRLYFYNDYSYFVQVNEESLKTATDTLKACGLNICEYSDTYFEGMLSAKEDMMVFTTIPYDKGWKIYVDGNKVESYMAVDAMLAFDITSGEHQIEMKYRPSELYIGLAISSMGIALFVLLIVLDNKKRKLMIQKQGLPDSRIILKKKYSLIKPREGFNSMGLMTRIKTKNEEK